MSSKKTDKSRSSRIFERDARLYSRLYRSSSHDAERMQMIHSRADFERDNKQKLFDKHNSNQLQEIAILIAAAQHLTNEPGDEHSAMMRALGPAYDRMDDRDRAALATLVKQINELPTGSDNPLALRRKAYLDSLGDLTRPQASRLLAEHSQRAAGQHIQSAQSARQALNTLDQTLQEFTADHAGEARANITKFATAVNQLDQSVLPKPTPSDISGLSPSGKQVLQGNDSDTIAQFCRDSPIDAQKDAHQLIKHAVSTLQDCNRRGTLNEHGILVNTPHEDPTGLNLGPKPTVSNLEQQLKDINASVGVCHMAEGLDQTSQQLHDADTQLRQAVEQHRHRLINPGAQVSGNELQALNTALKDYQTAKLNHQQACNKLFISASLHREGSLSAIKAVLSEKPNSKTNQSLAQGLSDKNLRLLQRVNARQASFNSESAAGYTFNDKARDFLGIRKAISKIWTMLAGEPKGLFKSIGAAMSQEMRKDLFKEFCISTPELRTLNAETDAGGSLNLGKDSFHFTVKFDDRALGNARREYQDWKKTNITTLKQERLEHNLQRAQQGLQPLKGSKHIERFTQQMYYDKTGRLAPPTPKRVKYLEDRLQKEFYQYCNKHMPPHQKGDISAHSGDRGGPPQDTGTGVETSRARQDAPAPGHETGATATRQLHDDASREAGDPTPNIQSGTGIYRAREIDPGERGAAKAQVAAAAGESGQPRATRTQQRLIT